MATQRKYSVWLGLTACLIFGAYIYRSSLEASNGPSGRKQSSNPRLALIVGGPDPFWQEVIVGAEEASKEFGATLTVIEPNGTGSGQTTALVRIVPDNFDGLAISPLAPGSQTQLISKLATKIKVVTYDNDVPDSLRHLYIGTDNVAGGRLAAELVMRALPDGGKIALFVGDNERQNARDRRHALINSLRGQSYKGQKVDEENADDVTNPIQAGDYTIVSTYLDDSNPEKALANAKQALQDHPQLAGMVGLYGYNGPACLEALQELDKLNEVKLVAFDNHEPTLKGVEEGLVEGTVVQDPYLYGYESIETLCKLCRGLPAAVPVPGAGSIALPSAVVDSKNLQKYQKNLRQRIATNNP